MLKRRGGVGQRKQGSGKRLDPKVAGGEKPAPEPAIHIANRKQHATPSPEKMRLLRHFRPSYVKTLLSKLLLVGEGRSRLSIAPPQDERAVR